MSYIGKCGWLFSSIHCRVRIHNPSGNAKDNDTDHSSLNLECSNATFISHFIQKHKEDDLFSKLSLTPSSKIVCFPLIKLLNFRKMAYLECRKIDEIGDGISCITINKGWVDTDLVDGTEPNKPYWQLLRLTDTKTDSGVIKLRKFASGHLTWDAAAEQNLECYQEKYCSGTDQSFGVIDF